ncbi:MAG TPA: hypothetical protein VME22_25225 [Solirubrobacteraceae bacterium]|nr:hypothetical protein [Solirubrobacteraceae bacterium]
MRDGNHAKRRARGPRVTLVGAMLVIAVIVAGCGGSSHSQLGATAGGASGSTSTGASGSGPLAFSKCMRANGVPGFPDLSSNGMRIGEHGQTVSVNGISVNASAFTVALPKCERYRQHTYGTPAQTAQQTHQALQFARCMRSHGVPNFPDPRVMAGADGNQVAYLPGVNIDAPAVQSAAKACGGGPKGP